VAEMMTVFGVMTAGLFPIVHLGRPWFAYWLFPYPNQRHLWVNFRSPLMWDVFAVSTYLIVSAIFLVVGIVPDAAALRDASRGWRRRLYAVFAAGWRGTDEEWRHYARAYLYFAAFATPLVFSVHSVVSWDFAVSILPGWHSTIFPPYFVAGAIFGGFAMVLTLLIPCRRFFGLQEMITLHHLENMGKVLLATGLMVGYAYVVEFFIAWYGGNLYERYLAINRALGPYLGAFWVMIFCNVVAPQLLWSKRLRTSTWSLMAVALCVDVGMWFERYVIIVTSLHRDFVPSSWGMFRPTWVDLLTLAGSVGLFMMLFLLFIRFLPMVAMAEVKTVMPGARLEHGLHRGVGDYHGEIAGVHEGEPEPVGDSEP